MSSSLRGKFRSIEIVSGPSFWPTAGWTVLVIFVQTVAAPFVTFRGGVPALVMIAVTLYATRVGVRRAAVLGVIAGALEDCFAGTGGAWTVATTLVAIAVGLVSRGFFSDGFPMLGALVAGAVLVRDAIFWGVMRLEGYPRGLGLEHTHAALVQAALTGALTVVYLIVRTRVVVDRTNVERYP